MQRISGKKQTKKMGKSSSKNKNDTDESIELLMEIYFMFGFHLHLAKKSIKFTIKTFIFST